MEASVLEEEMYFRLELCIMLSAKERIGLEDDKLLKSNGGEMLTKTEF